jgi:uncharacterized protein (UPF0332 family)
MIKSFADCLKSNKIKKFSRGKELTGKELRLAEEDFKTAQTSFNDKNYRWCIIQIYYSMFHSARALLYFKNYREHSHYCLGQAIRELYVKNHELEAFFLEALLEARNLREAADYYGDYSKINSSKLLDKAKRFNKRVKEMIENT